MAEENSGNTPLPKNVDLQAAIKKYLPGLATKVDNTFGILLERKPDQVDDLTEISGIGPVNAEKLHNLGVYRYSQIASWSESIAEAFGDKLEFPGRIEREDWVPQAQALAKPAGPVRSARPDLADYDRLHNLFRDEPVKVDQDLGFVYTERYQADDLTRINGVGKSLSKKLNAAGIYRFKQIANWNQYNIEEFDERLDSALGHIEREDWIPQCRRLMSEDANLSSGTVGSGTVGSGTVGSGKVGAGVAAGAAVAVGTTAMAMGFGNEDDTVPILDDDTTPLDGDAPPIASQAPRKSDTSRVDVPKATHSERKSETARMEVPVAKPATAKSDTSRISIAKAESGQINVEDDIFKAQTMPINLDAAKGDTTNLSLDDDTIPLDDTGPIQAALAKKKSDTSKIEIGDFSPDEDIFNSSTMPMDDFLDSPKGATAQLQDADTVPMDDDADSIGIIPIPSIPSAAKSTTMAIADVPDEAATGKPKIKRPSQLKPKSIKRPPSVKKPEATEATGAVADAPKTVKLKRPGAAADGDAPKTVKLKKAPAPNKDVSTDSSKKTVKLQKRPAPTQGGLKLNKDSSSEEETGKKKKKKKRKSRASMGAFWIVLSVLTLLLAASGLMVLMNSAYPNDQNGNQALSMTFPLEGVDANIPFPKPKSTGPVFAPVKPKRAPITPPAGITPDGTDATTTPAGTTELEPITAP